MLRQALPIVVLSAVVGIVLGGIALRPPHPQVPAAVVTGERPYDRAERLARGRWADFALTSGPGTPAAADAADSLVRALLDNGRAWAAETLALARSAVAIREA